jgi:spore coat polysaccharide biosynthesis predicted glycosyltransferase SpsG
MGAGHVLRALALAQGWLARGGRVVYLCADVPAPLSELLTREGCAIEELGLPIPRTSGSPDDAACTLESCLRHKADWLLLDGYAFGVDYVADVVGRGVRVMQIDDGSLLPRYEVDIVLNPSGHTKASAYEGKLGVGSRLMAGAEYTLLRREVLEAAQMRRHEVRENVCSILTSFGGSDPPNMTARVLRALAHLPIAAGLDVLAVAGILNPRIAALEQLAGSLPMRVTVARDCPDFPARAAACDMAVIAGGTTLQEFEYLGVPTVLVAVAENQIEGVRFAHRRGLAVAAGEWRTLNDAVLHQALAGLAGNWRLRRQLSESGRAFIDGQGVKRVLDAMLAAGTMQSS